MQNGDWNEQARLDALERIAILDTAPESFFEDVVDLVTESLSVPVALVSIVDETRQWFKARRGLEVTETIREHAFCAQAIMSDEALVIRDATNDVRVKGNPLILGAPYVVSYLGVPIKLECGARLGTVCAIDHKPRDWSAGDVRQMQRWARLVSRHLDTRRSHVERDRHKFLEIALQRTERRYQSLIEVMSEGMVIHGPSGAIIDYNLAACEILSLSEDELLGLTSRDPRWRSIYPNGDDFPGEDHPVMVTLRTGLGQQDISMGIVAPNGERRWLLINSYPVEDPRTKALQVIVVFRRTDAPQIAHKAA
jgi:PAS domain S-box-containing protein